MVCRFLSRGFDRLEVDSNFLLFYIASLYRYPSLSLVLLVF